MSDFPSQSRYDSMIYNRCGDSGFQLPLISLGLWHNFGGVDVFETGRATVRTAFDHGITHLDLANNYGPPYGSAEETLAQMAIAWVLRQKAVTTALCGASRPEQIEDSLGVLDNLNFTEDELQTIDNILAT